MSSSGEKRAAKSHPAYAEMITAAIVALKERGGSSVPAIRKYIESTFKGMSSGNIVRSVERTHLQRPLSGTWVGLLNHVKRLLFIGCVSNLFFLSPILVQAGTSK